MKKLLCVFAMILATSLCVFAKPTDDCVKLEKLAEVNPTIYWLSEDDDLGCVFIDCDRLPIEEDLTAGTVEEAIEHGHTHLCSVCLERLLEYAE